MSEKMKSYQIIYEQTVKERIVSFAIADTEEQARKMLDNDDDVFYSKEILEAEGDIVEINEMECRIKKEEGNEYTKNYPKRPLD
mgnify:CR=1 FL=1